MKKYEIDMCKGSIFPKMLAFALPLMLTGILQLLFNAADVVVVGKFCGDNSLAAVGATTVIVNLFVNVFMGLSIGTNVMVSVAYGAKDYDKLHRTVQTSVLASLILGIFVAIIGAVLAKPILSALGTPVEVIDKAASYLRIYFLGMPALLVFNYASAVLRAVGDTKRPLFILSVAGVINVILNIVFTVYCHLDVKGVALATIISEYLSMIIIIMCLLRTKECYKYDIKELKIYKKEFLEMMKLGVPAALYSSIFSLSNMAIQSAVNSFGQAAVAGNSVASSIEGFVYTSMNSFHHATLAFTGQNHGAGQYKRMKSVLINALMLVTVVGLAMGYGCIALSDELVSLYTNSAEVMLAAKTRISIIMPTYFMCGIMEVFVGSIRGYGYSVLPTIISGVGVLTTRLIWIYAFCLRYGDISLLYYSWFISYIFVDSAFVICYILIDRKTLKEAKRLKTN